MEIEKIIKLAKKGNREAQRLLYEQYKAQLFTVCLRYSRDRSEAEDILQEGFIRIFNDLHQYKGQGAISGWMRKVMVNVALQYLRRWKRDWRHLDTNDFEQTLQVNETVFSKLGLEELTILIQRLPLGYRLVFNLFVIEGFSHKEIAALLNISVNTSKTQLLKAKANLKRQLEDQFLASF